MPLPITPTQLTVFTKVCAVEESKSPISTLTTTLLLLEEHVLVDGYVYVSY